MIETTYVMLEKAAEMLGTDRETLLLAAIEGRIKLYGLFGHSVEALGGSICTDEEFDLVEMARPTRCYVTYVMLERDEPIQLLKNGRVRPSSFESQTYFAEADQGVIWDIYSPDDEVPEVSIDDVLIKRVDVENIKANACLPEPETIPPPNTRKSAITRRNDTLHVIIAALARQAQICLDDREAAGRIEGYVRRIGASISPQTTKDVINKVLERIPESLERRTK